MLVEFGKITQTKVTISPQIKLPSTTEIHICQKSRPRRTAKHVPLQTPVRGTGKATNKRTYSIFIMIFLTEPVCLCALMNELVFLISSVKNLIIL